MLKRTVGAGEIDENLIGNVVIVNGWLHRKRNLGGILFLDVRDRSGIVQVVVNPNDIPKEKFETIENLKVESVLAVKGTVKRRETPNPKLKTGFIEIQLSDFEIFSKAEDLPFNPFVPQDVDEIVRLKYRYLDLRREEMRNIFEFRAQITQCIRNYLSSKGFIEVETPYLTKSTPEGARDFLVPSRLNRGKFYALPQSPQLFKQILMISGFEKYFQIARCFRDEDLRLDRQPEFTQIDMEMSFVEQDDIIALVEDMYKTLFKEVMEIEIQTPFPRIDYKDAIRFYGSDKPDTRFDMKIIDFTDTFKDTQIKVFQNDGSKLILGLAIDGVNNTSRSEVDKLKEQVKQFGVNGFIDFKINGEEISSQFSKFLTEKERKDILKYTKDDSLVTIFVVDKKGGFEKIGRIRLFFGERFNKIDKEKFNFLWVVNFPFFSYSEEEGRFVAEHHPFTMPNPEDLDKLETDKENVRAIAYDLVLNGNELGGGSIRIHDSELQKRVFRAIGLSDEEIESRFGFLVKAFRFGAPPHGGIAFGLDRLVWILSKANSLRDVIAFPKTTSGTCPLTDAPSEVDKKQLDELGIDIKNG
ncbi:aspartate--tRNA ligase [Caldisericum exile]|uniref:Aspartate--tRNA ligase n=1 Tax=Caldisericum exile (strain DSM 21853 / NBRC 104410 / AZM16c01) TaxID=511051 RepID=A0A7U6GEE1_CALEA|nr:aspartate--tRNA ligase [Caldisericum exile]BAL80867.1 aspartyl-tRNA synthetase [Caldisericum exile AZM16c01]